MAFDTREMIRRADKLQVAAANNEDDLAELVAFCEQLEEELEGATDRVSELESQVVDLEAQLRDGPTP